MVIQSLSRDIMNAAGQVVQSLEYTGLASVAYSTTPILGARAPTTWRPTTATAPRATRFSTVDAAGTRTETFYDALGRQVMQWQGTVEPAGFRDWAVAYPTATDSPTGAMYKVSSQVCDYNGVGDSDLTSSTTYAGDGSGDAYTTYYEYDSRTA